MSTSDYEFPYGPADASHGMKTTKHALWEAIYYYAMNPLPMYQRDKTLVELSIKCLLDAHDMAREDRERESRKLAAEADRDSIGGDHG